jgi:uncharacterized membrane protein YeaQ/YmgE (transglycosylase-associated protein family)
LHNKGKEISGEIIKEVNMSQGIWDFLQAIVAILIVVALGALVSFIFYTLKRRDLFGGFIGGMVIGVIGALIGGYILNNITMIIMDFLAKNQYVNVISGFIGAYIAIYIMNRLNHNKERKKY